LKDRARIVEEDVGIQNEVFYSHAASHVARAARERRCGVDAEDEAA
jgi:hypothetical protein